MKSVITNLNGGDVVQTTILLVLLSVTQELAVFLIAEFSLTELMPSTLYFLRGKLAYFGRNSFI